MMTEIPKLKRYGVSATLSSGASDETYNILRDEMDYNLKKSAGNEGLALLGETAHERRLTITLEGTEYFECQAWAYIKEYSHQDWLVGLIVKAITDEGTHPQYHKKILDKQRKMHPVLWRYLDGLVQYKLSEQGDTQ